MRSESSKYSITALSSCLPLALHLMDGCWLAYDPQNDISALNELRITQHKDILLIFCRIFAKADSGLAVQWNNLWTSILKQNESVQQESNCIIVLSWCCVFVLATYLSKYTIWNWWSIAMYCWGFKVYNFDRVSLRRQWSVSDKAENDGSYLYYVVSVSISKSSTVISQMLK